MNPALDSKGRIKKLFEFLLDGLASAESYCVMFRGADCDSRSVAIRLLDQGCDVEDGSVLRCRAHGLWSTGARGHLDGLGFDTRDELVKLFELEISPSPFPPYEEDPYKDPPTCYGRFCPVTLELKPSLSFLPPKPPPPTIAWTRTWRSKLTRKKTKLLPEHVPLLTQRPFIRFSYSSMNSVEGEALRQADKGNS